MDNFKQYVTEKDAGVHVNLEPLKYGTGDLDPVMTLENVEHHYDVHTKGYHKKQTESDFQKNGLVLHNLWWSTLQPPKQNNLPSGEIKKLIDDKFGSLTSFKTEWETQALGIQGSGWVALTKQGRIVQIKNHSRVGDFIMILDMWEHAFYPTYGPDKKEYVRSMWSVYNWKKINEMLTD